MLLQSQQPVGGTLHLVLRIRPSQEDVAAEPVTSRTPSFHERVESDMQPYMDHIRAANEVCKRNFNEGYFQLAHDLRSWTATQRAEPGLLRDRSIEVVQFERRYFEMRDALYRIRTAYFDALTKCSPPTLDSITLQELKKMGIQMEKVQQRYQELFVDYPGKMREQIRKINALLIDIQSAYDEMKDFISSQSLK